MFLLREVLTASLCLLVCNYASAQVSSAVHSVSRNWNLPKHIIKYEETVFADTEDRFSYLVCEHQNAKMPLSCNVTVESWLAPNVTHRNTCEIPKLTNETGDEWMFRKSGQQLWSVNSDRIIILRYAVVNNATTKSKVAQLRIIDISNCSITAELVFNSNFIKLILYRDSFELILRSNDKCGDQNAKCRIIYDFEGRQIGDPQPFDAELPQVLLPMDHQSTNKGYYQFRGGSPWTGLYIDASGRSIKTILLGIEHSGNWVGGSYSLSNAHELLAFCWLDDASGSLVLAGGFRQRFSRKVHCRQSDIQGPRMNVTLELPYNTTWVATRNLNDGELLLATGKCEPKENHTHCNGFQVQRITVDGELKYRTLDVDGLESRVEAYPTFVAKITENDKSEFCFSGTWEAKMKGYTDLRYDMWCIPMKDTLTPV